MLKHFIMPFLLMLSIATAQADQAAIQWHPNSEIVFQQAKDANRTVIMFIKSDGCHWCKKMTRTTFANPKVVEMINENFYPVMLNADTDEAGVKKYQIDSVPVIMFFDSEGKVKKSFPGYAESDVMVKHLTDMKPAAKP